ncbi:hypothetical protein PG997_011745 [Apiospora hydei]|uniref:F-box domain-containing protein n=1 Tax=Apiospora hydei TaxID=1337664 RepID=A0ABR1V4S5_9PEZI
MASWPLPTELTSIVMDMLASESREELPKLATVCIVWRDLVQDITFRTITKAYRRDDNLGLLPSVLSRAGNIQRLRCLDLTFYDIVMFRCASVVREVMGLLGSLEEEAHALEHPRITMLVWLFGTSRHYGSTPPDSRLLLGSLPKVRFIKEFSIMNFSYDSTNDLSLETGKGNEWCLIGKDRSPAPWTVNLFQLWTLRIHEISLGLKRLTFDGETRAGIEVFGPLDLADSTAVEWPLLEEISMGYDQSIIQTLDPPTEAEMKRVARLDPLAACLR